MFGNRRFKHVGIALLLGGACACGQQKSKGIDFDPAGFDGFDETHFDLLAADCSLAGGNLALTVGPGETAYVYQRASDSKVVANASVAGAECSVASGKTITVTGATGSAQTVIIDFYSGTFSLATASPPNITINLGGDAGDMVKVRATSGADLITLGTNQTNGKSYFSINTVGATARSFADISMTGVKSIVTSTGPGADTIIAQGGAAVGSASGTGNAVTALDGSISLVVYGGDDNDTITSGAPSTGGVHNVLNGGAGNDLFLQQDLVGGVGAADWIVGGDGVDTVDYAIRTSPVRVTLGGTTAAAKATGSFLCKATSQIADNDSFTIKADSNSAHSKTFAYQVSATGAFAAGSITCPVQSAFADNEYFILSDGTNTKKFNYQVTPNTMPTGTITVSATVVPTEGDHFTLTDTYGVSQVFTYALPGSSATITDAFIDLTSYTTTPPTPAQVATATYNTINATHSPTLHIHATTPTGAAAPVIALADTGTTYGLGTAPSAIVGTALTFAGMNNGSVYTNTVTGSVPIDISTVTTDVAVCAATYTAIHGAYNSSTFTVDATNPSGATTVALHNTVAQTGDVAIDITHMVHSTVPVAGFTVTGMTGAWVESSTNTGVSAIIINISGATTASDVCGLTYTAIHNAYDSTNFAVTATDPAGDVVIPLINDATGVAGNQGIVISSLAKFTAVGMHNGSAAITSDDGDIASTEGDDIGADVENVIGGQAGDTIDASHSTSLSHVLMGMSGDDTLIGASYATVTSGTQPINYLYGGVGNDTLIGGNQADYLYGGTGDDTLQGGLGNDIINGGGVNCLSAVSTTTAPIAPFINATYCTSAIATAPTNPGNDTLDYSDRGSSVSLYVDLTNLANCTTHPMGATGTGGTTGECDSIVGTGTGANEVANVINIRGGAGSDILIGDSRNNTIWGGDGDDTISGGVGNDLLYGERGNDTIYGDSYNAALCGAAPLLTAPDCYPALTGTQTDNDYINGGLGTNHLYGQDGLDTIDSSAGTNDVVDCGTGDGDIDIPSGHETTSRCEL